MVIKNGMMERVIVVMVNEMGRCVLQNLWAILEQGAISQYWQSKLSHKLGIECHGCPFAHDSGILMEGVQLTFDRDPPTRALEFIMARYQGSWSSSETVRDMSKYTQDVTYHRQFHQNRLLQLLAPHHIPGELLWHKIISHLTSVSGETVGSISARCGNLGFWGLFNK